MGGGSAGRRSCREDLSQGQGPSCLQRRQGPCDPLRSLLPWASTSGSLQPGAQGWSGAGCGGLSWVALAPCSAMGGQLHCPWSHCPGSPGAAQGAVWVLRLPAQHGACKEPWYREQGSLSCPGKGRCCSRLCSGVSSSFSLVPCELPRQGRQALCPACQL